MILENNNADHVPRYSQQMKVKNIEGFLGNDFFANEVKRLSQKICIMLEIVFKTVR